MKPEILKLLGVVSPLLVAVLSVVFGYFVNTDGYSKELFFIYQFRYEIIIAGGLITAVSIFLSYDVMSKIAFSYQKKLSVFTCVLIFSCLFGVWLFGSYDVIKMYLRERYFYLEQEMQYDYNRFIVGYGNYLASVRDYEAALKYWEGRSGGATSSIVRRRTQVEKQLAYSADLLDLAERLEAESGRNVRSFNLYYQAYLVTPYNEKAKSAVEDYLVALESTAGDCATTAWAQYGWQKDFSTLSAVYAPCTGEANFSMWNVQDTRRVVEAVEEGKLTKITALEFMHYRPDLSKLVYGGPVDDLVSRNSTDMGFLTFLRHLKDHVFGL